LSPTVIDPESAEVESLVIRPRPDISRPAVVLRYHHTHRSNGYAWERIHTDFYPNPLPEDWRKRALVSSIELAGSVLQESWLEQPVETRALPDLNFSGPITDGPALNFW